MNIRLTVPYKENTLRITILFQYITQILQVVVNRLMSFAIDTVFMRCIKIRMRQQLSTRNNIYIAITDVIVAKMQRLKPGPSH